MFGCFDDVLSVTFFVKDLEPEDSLEVRRKFWA